MKKRVIVVVVLLVLNCTFSFAQIGGRGGQDSSGVSLTELSFAISHPKTEASSNTIMKTVESCCDMANLVFWCTDQHVDLIRPYCDASSQFRSR